MPNSSASKLSASPKLGSWLFNLLGIEWGGVLGQLGTAIVGAVAILWIASLIKK